MSVDMRWLFFLGLLGFAATIVALSWPKKAVPGIDILRVCEEVLIAGLSVVATKAVEYVYERLKRRGEVPKE